MTRQSRNFWISIISFVAALFCLFAWATSGFNYLDPAQWFDRWGKGITVTAEPTDAQAEQSESGKSKSTVNAGIIYDSPDATSTVSVKQLSAPTYEYADNGVYVNVNYPPFGTLLHVYVRAYGSDEKIVLPNGLDVAGSFYQSNGGGINVWRTHVSHLSIKQFADYIYEQHPDWYPNGGNVRLFAEVSPTYSGYTSNSSYSEYLLFPVVDVDVEFQETTLSINSFSGNEPYWGIPALVGPSGTKVYKGYFAHVNGNGHSLCLGMTGAVHNCGLQEIASNSIRNNYWDIDLVSLPFADELGEYTVSFYGISLGVSQNQAATQSHVILNIPPVHFTISRLPSPEDITYTQGVLTWNDVDGAYGYAVFIDDLSFVVDEPEFDASEFIRETGDYTVRVRALGNIGQALATNELTLKMSAFNAGTTVTRMVLVNFDIDGDVVTKFVPYGSTLSAQLYEVVIDGREFGGWFYDKGFSRPVAPTDELTSDITLYARLSDLQVTERPLRWYEKYLWYWLAPCIAAGALIAIAIVAIAVKKRKSK